MTAPTMLAAIASVRRVTDNPIFVGVVWSALVVAATQTWSAWRNGFLRIVWLGVTRRNIRFSASALLRLRDGAGYLLIETPARGEAAPYWGPLGGVIKYKEGAANRFADLGVRDSTTPSTSDDDMTLDLRVVIAGRNIHRFLHWFKKDRDRESSEKALRRELREELCSVGMPDAAAVAADMAFDEVRCARRLFKDPADPFLYHYRRFFVLEPNDPREVDEFVRLVKAAHDPRLEFVPEEAIRRGRYAQRNVGAHTLSFFQQNLTHTRSDEPLPV